MHLIAIPAPDLIQRNDQVHGVASSGAESSPDLVSADEQVAIR
jgi:hypothetical protein